MQDKSLFFLTLSLVCVWLIIDNYVGNKYINNFLTNMFNLKGLSTQKTVTPNQEDGSYLNEDFAKDIEEKKEQSKTKDKSIYDIQGGRFN